MNVEERLASALDRNDEAPNIALAVKIAQSKDPSAITALIDILSAGKKPARHDAIKVLYEIGNREPDLIAPHIDGIASHLTSKDNRMVWGALTALDSIAKTHPETIVPLLTTILEAADCGSVIAKDKAMSILLTLSQIPTYQEHAIKTFNTRLRYAAPNQLPMYCEMFLEAHKDNAPFSSKDLEAICTTIELRQSDMPTPAKAKRLAKVLKTLQVSST